MKKLVVVVDMVNGFVNFGNLADKNINRIVPNCVKLVQTALEEGDRVVAFKDCHTINDPEFKAFPPHCIKGSQESELVPELKPYEKFMTVIEKPTTNGFKTQAFKDLIEKETFDCVVVAGCCTDICVANFLESLYEYLQEKKQNTSLYVVADAVDTFGGKDHNPDQINKQYLEIFEKEYGATIFEISTNAENGKNAGDIEQG